jgi:hypothetical protein
MASTAVSPNSAAAGSCPRCQQPLIDPTGLGWCKACGYCRSLGDEKPVAAPVAVAGPHKPTMLEAAGTIRYLPTWIWFSALTVALLCAAVYFGNRYYHPKPFPRALWATIQLGAGIALIFLGQFTALFRLAPEDPSLSFMHAIMPVGMYGPMFKQLPSTSWSFYLVCWGKALIITATSFIGGFDHWFVYLKR